MARCRALFIAPYPELVDVVNAVAPKYPELEITIHTGDLSAGITVALENLGADYDVLISRGGTAQMLEDEFDLPVIEVGVSGSDLFDALLIHNPEGRRTAVIGFANALQPLEPMVDFADFDIELFEVSFEDELPLVLQDVTQGHFDVILCDAFSYRKCQSLGLNAHLLSSGRQSVARAFEQSLFYFRQSRSLSSKNRMLWQLIQSQPTRLVIFSSSGRLEYSNLSPENRDLVDYLRSHIEDGSPARLATRRGRQIFRIVRSLIGDEETAHVAFSVSVSNLPFKDSMTGIDRMNRDDAQRLYNASTFHVVSGGDCVAPLITAATKSKDPIMLVGEHGSGKAQIALLVYLSSGWQSAPLSVIDFSLLVEKSWDYFLNSYGSPLFSNGETIYLKSLHAVEGEKLRRLLETLEKSEACKRNHVIASADDGPDGTECAAVTSLTERLHFQTLPVPTLRSRGDLPSAIKQFIDIKAASLRIPSPIVSDEALGLLLRYPWPHNYLELRQVLTRAVTTSKSGVIGEKDVQDALGRDNLTNYAPSRMNADPQGIDLLRPLKEIERDIVRLAIERCGGNQTEAARVLGLSRTTIWRLLRETPEE